MRRATPGRACGVPTLPTFILRVIKRVHLHSRQFGLYLWNTVVASCWGCCGVFWPICCRRICSCPGIAILLNTRLFGHLLYRGRPHHFRWVHPGVRLRLLLTLRLVWAHQSWVRLLLPHCQDFNMSLRSSWAFKFHFTYNVSLLTNLTTNICHFSITVALLFDVLLIAWV